METPKDVDGFLDAGEPPIAFAPSSAATNLQAFIAAAVDACRILKRRGILMTRFADHLTKHLPPTIKHVSFARHSQVLPRCAAVVSHGGIGTVSQGLRAGIPQVIMPMNYDQPEHARRLTELKVAQTLWPKRLSGSRLARCIHELLANSKVHQRCKQLAASLPADKPVNEACDRIEQFAGCESAES